MDWFFANRPYLSKEKMGERRFNQKTWKELFVHFVIVLCPCLFLSGLLLLIVYSYLGNKYAIYEYAPPNETICQDGWHSYSVGSGTCSHHSGVRIRAGGSLRTGEFQAGWWDKEKVKIYILAPALLLVSIIVSAFMASRPDHLTPEHRAIVDAAINAINDRVDEKRKPSV